MIKMAECNEKKILSLYCDEVGGSYQTFDYKVFSDIQDLGLPDIIIP